MDNRILEKNLGALEKKIKGCTELIKSKCESKVDEIQENIEIILQESWTQETVSIIKKNGRSLYLSGKYCPEGMAEFYAQKIEIREHGTVVYIVGFSDGRVIRQILNRIQEFDKVCVIVYEPSLDIFAHVIQHYDLSDIFQNEKLNLFVKGINGKEMPMFFPAFIGISNLAKVKPYIMENYEQLFYEEVKEGITIIERYMQSVQIRWNTNMLYSERAVNNIIKNSKYIYDHYSINVLFDKLPKEVPVIVVAAGPSLDKNIKLIEKAKGKACIIACDTALKPLLKRDIVPDFFVVIDPGKSKELFEDVRIKDIPMISGINIPDYVMQMHKGKKFFRNDTAFTVGLLKEVFGEKFIEHPMSMLQAGGSVATTAFTLARKMGTETIILVGQDLAYSDGRKHVSGAFNSSQEVDFKKEEYIMVEGINGEMLPTRLDLKMYLEWFEEQIQECDKVTVVDATEGGALIQGSKVMLLEEAINAYCNSCFGVEAFVKDMEKHFSDIERKRTLEFFKSIPMHLEQLKIKIVKEKEYYDKIEKISKKDSMSVKELKKVMKKIKNLNEELEKDTLLNMIMVGKAKEEFMIRMQMYNFSNNEQEDLSTGARMGKVYLTFLERQIEEVLPEFEILSRFNGEYV